MNALASIPTRKDEAWRYSDIAALAPVWDDAVARTLVTVAAGETRALHLIQNAAPDDVVVRDYAITLGAGATASLHIVNTGGRLGRVSVRVVFGEGAHFELGGVNIGDTGQTLEIVTEMIHAEPGATSNQVVRSVLGGKGVGSFLGKVAVARDAQKTDASQSVKAMLLSRHATANAKPELEIYADDVKCAHGATVGELDQAALFYMAARGIEPPVARRLMLQAFVADAFVSVSDDAMRGELEAAALAALERVA